jgi:hypothetical protein
MRPPEMESPGWRTGAMAKMNELKQLINSIKVFLKIQVFLYVLLAVVAMWGVAR